ncbi:MAG: cupin domain-containing protein [Thaumarchaeota archaeon]|nr:cupin domain-containing protein [Nitrososphaerota archaeon]
MAVILHKENEPISNLGDGRDRVFLVGKTQTRSKQLAADVVTYAPNAQNKNHHHKSESFIYIIEGDCEMHINGKMEKIGKETMVYLDPGDWHWMKNVGKGKMVMLEAFAPDADITPYYEEGKH